MTSPTNSHGIRFVPENNAKELPALEFKISKDYAKSPWGIFTILQMLSSLVTFVVSVSSRTHKYEVTDLVVYVAPKASIMFVLIYSFCFFYLDFLLILASTVSNFDAHTLQRSIFYVFVTISAAIFNIGASIAIFLIHPVTSLNQTIASLALVSGSLFTVRCLWIWSRILKARQAR